MTTERRFAEMYKYEISGYYFANDNEDERTHFYHIVEARDNFEAMEMVVGKIAFSESRAGNSFKLDVIHYECL